MIIDLGRVGFDVGSRQSINTIQALLCEDVLSSVIVSPFAALLEQRTPLLRRESLRLQRSRRRDREPSCYTKPFAGRCK